MTDNIYDDAGRLIAPPQAVIAPRPSGPWDANVAEVIVNVCAWCPDNRERTAAAHAAGHKVSHGMCPTCHAKMNAQLDAEEAK